MNLKSLLSNKSSLFIFLILLTLVLLPFVKLNPLNFYSLEFDETESIHSAWLISQGFTPYVDFFQHHQPLLWYLLQLSFIFGEEYVLFISKSLAFLVGFGTIFMIYKLSEELSLDKKITVLLLLLSGVFIYHGFDIKQDVFGVFFALISIYFLLKFYNNRSNAHLFISGFFSILSVLTSLKMAFFLFLISLFILYILFFKRRSKKLKDSFISIVCYIFPIFVISLIFLTYILPYFDVYYKLLFVLNSKVNALSLPDVSKLFSFSTTSQFNQTLFLNGLSLFLGFFISLNNLFSRKNNFFSLVSIIFLVYSGIWLLSVNKSMHSVMFAVVLVPLLISNFINENNITNLLNKKFIILLIVLLLSRNIILMFYDPPLPYTESINFIQSTPAETVFYDESSSNLFRPDACYLWFATFNNVGETALELLEKDNCEVQVKENHPDYIILKEGTRSGEFLSFVYSNYSLVKSVKDLDFFKAKE